METAEDEMLDSEEQDELIRSLTASQDSQAMLVRANLI
jgi:hypothetical protein